MAVIEQVREAVRAAAALAGPGPAARRVLVACSGGPDSMTLADALQALAPGLGLSLELVHVDHGLRAESGAEARQVMAWARAGGIPAAVLPIAPPSGGMAGARAARYRALLAWAEARLGAEGGMIAVAHTATDQAETFLDRLLRGAGTIGLAAMAPRRWLAPGVELVRPLLAVTRAETAAYVAARGLPVTDDPTNGDRRYRRTRLRQELLPLLRRERPDFDREVAATCARLRIDAEALQAQASEALGRLGGPTGLEVSELNRLAEALKLRVMIQAAGVPLERRHLAALGRLCADQRGTRVVSLPSGVIAERRYGTLRFGAAVPDPGDVELEVLRGGRYALLGTEVELDEATVRSLREPGSRLLLRNLRPGDRTRRGKLQDLFVDRKVPRPERRRRPLLVRMDAARTEVLWVAGLGPVGWRPPAEPPSIIYCSLTPDGSMQ